MNLGMKTRIDKLFSKLLLIVGVALIVFSVVQELPLVLCFEPNGQVELEAATAKGACVDWQANVKPVDLLSGLVQHCVDVPLSQAQLQWKAVTPAIRQWAGVLSFHGLVSWLPRLLGCVMPVFSHPQWAKPPPVTGMLSGFLKTIILLL